MGVVFRHTVEAFLERVVRRRRLFTPEELSALGANPVDDLPLDTWLALVRAAAARLCPGTPEAEALEEAGREMVRGYREGLVGRSVFLVARLAGPRATLLRLPDSYRTADSLIEVTATAQGPTEVWLHYTSVFGIPTYVRGVLSELMVSLSVDAHEVRFNRRTDGTTDFVVTWTR